MSLPTEVRQPPKVIGIARCVTRLSHHPAVDAAERAVTAVRLGKGLDGGAARQCIVVEITQDCLDELRALAIGSDSEWWRLGENGVGPLTINMVRYYLVGSVGGDDQWRVLNALGER